MRQLILLFFCLVSTSPAQAGADQVMQDLIWDHRVLIIFASNKNGAGLEQQDAMLARVPEVLADRDMVIIRVSDSVTIDNQAHTASPESFRQRHDANANKFRVILVGKDGTVKLDQDEPVAMENLLALIDAMPMRQYEMLQDDE